MAKRKEQPAAPAVAPDAGYTVLARRYRPRLVLVGSSPAPADEPADTAGLSGAAELKAALMKRLGGDANPRREGTTVPPTHVLGNGISDRAVVVKRKVR